jgi:hypothetical protein
MDLVTTATRAGQHCWTETRLFELLGAWMHDASDPEVVVHLGQRCQRHGRHAQAWRARIAAVPDVDDALIAAVNDADAQAWEALGRPGAATSARLGALYRYVLPRVVADYQADLARLDPLVDGPTCALLEAVIDDEQSAIIQGQALLGEPA